MPNKAIVPAVDGTVTFNGRAMEPASERSDRNNQVIHRLALTQQELGAEARKLVVIIEDESLLERFGKEDLVVVKAHLGNSNLWDTCIVADEIDVVEEIELFTSGFEITGERGELKSKRLPARGKGKRQTVSELEVAGKFVVMFGEEVRQAALDSSPGDQVKVGGYVKTRSHQGLLRSSLRATTLGVIA